MKAIAITQAAADGNNIPSLTEIDLPIPTAHGRDLLVAVKAISVNPVDTKVRAALWATRRGCWAGTPLAWCSPSVRK